jgi:hypothetical protein
LPGTAPANNGTFAAVGNGVGAALQNGDTFEIRELTQMLGTVRSAGIPTRVQLVWQDIQFTAASNLVIDDTDMRFVTCQMLGSLSAGAGRGQTFNAAARFFGCLINSAGGLIPEFDCRVRFVGCGILGTTLAVFNTGRMETLNSVVQGGQGVRVGHTATGFGGDTAPTGGQFGNFNGVFGLGVFDATSAGFLNSRGGMLSSDAPLYGSGNLVGFDALEGSKSFMRTGITRNLTGTTELRVEGAATAIPALVAGAGVPAASALATWADLAAAPFLGNVMDYRTGTAISTVALPTV